MENTVFAMANAINGCQFANITYISDAGIPKKVGIGGNVTKVIRMGVQLNYSYANAVNNRLERQGDERTFVAESLPWGKWVAGYENLLIEHKGAIYLRFYAHKGADIKSLWLVDGRPASADEFTKIMNYLRNKSTASKKQADAGLVENQVQPKVVKVSNILRLAVDHQEWSFAEQSEFALATR